MWGDPHAFASALGIRLVCLSDLPFHAGSSEDFAVYRWHPDSDTRTDRAWEAVAGALLARSGVAWSAAEAAAFAKKLRELDVAGKSRFIA